MTKKNKWDRQNTRPTEQQAVRNIKREARRLMVSEAAVVKAHRFLNVAKMPTTRAAVAQLAYQYNDAEVCA